MVYLALYDDKSATFEAGYMPALGAYELVNTPTDPSSVCSVIRPGQKAMHALPGAGPAQGSAVHNFYGTYPVILRQNRLRQFADHRVGWVIDIAEVIFHCLAHENVCAHRVDPQVLL